MHRLFNNVLQIPPTDPELPVIRNALNNCTCMYIDVSYMYMYTEGVAQWLERFSGEREVVSSIPNPLYKRCYKNGTRCLLK